MSKTELLNKLNELKNELEKAKETLFWAEMCDDFLYTRGNGYELSANVRAIENQIKALEILL